MTPPSPTYTHFQIDGPANKVSLQRLRVAHFPHLFHVIGDELREVPSMARSLEEVRLRSRG